MKKTAFWIGIYLMVLSVPALAQEKFGRTLNIGIGATYYRYVGHSSPVIMLNYELDVAKNITLAPFIGFFTYTNAYYYWNGRYYHPGRKHHYDPYYQRYRYRQTVVPIGVKGTYYFDELLDANKDWDFYAALSLGFAIRSTTWDNDIYRDEDYVRESSVYADLHFGAEYHISKAIGVYADLSLGMFTLGLAVHH